MNETYIAVFDSGMGGFTTLLDAVTRFPDENFLFYADTKHVPYGEKPLHVTRELTMNSVKEILSYHVKAIILACNTATSAAAEQLRAAYQVPVIGMEPAVKPALASLDKDTPADRVLLLSTQLTMQGKKLTELIRQIDPDQRIDCLPLPGLVELAEAMDFNSPDVIRYLNETVLSRNLQQYGAVVLGCTHFIWYKDLLKSLLPSHTRLFDGNAGTLNNLHNILQEKGQLTVCQNNERTIALHFTGKPEPQKIQMLTHKLNCPVTII